MSTIHLHQTTTSTPEQFLAALIAFGPGRSRLFGLNRPANSMNPPDRLCEVF
jgi:hypothetical protein